MRPWLDAASRQSGPGTPGELLATTLSPGRDVRVTILLWQCIKCNYLAKVSHQGMSVAFARDGPLDSYR